LRARQPGLRCVFIAPGGDYRRENERLYSLRPGERADYQRALTQIKADHGMPGAIVQLWALSSPSRAADGGQIVSLLQGAAHAGVLPEKLLLGGRYEEGLTRCHLDAWLGFERTLRPLLTGTRMACVLQSGSAQDWQNDAETYLTRVVDELLAVAMCSSRYEGGVRHESCLEVSPPSDGVRREVLRRGMTCLITGGGGGLGALFARYLARRYGARLILTGRTVENEQIRGLLSELNSLGGEGCYIQAAVEDEAAMGAGLARARARFGGIEGVLHAAGVAGSVSVLEQSSEEFERVSRVKVSGTERLDGLLRDDPLEFVHYFSSAAAIVGDNGSCDYAVANRFQQAYASYRNERRDRGEVRGTASVMNWTYWTEGGIRFASDALLAWFEDSGQRGLTSQEGLEEFEHLLAEGRCQRMVLAGRPDLTEKLITHAQGKLLSPTAGKTQACVDAGRLQEKLENEIKTHIQSLLKIPSHKQDVEIGFLSFGFNSLTFISFASLLSARFGVEVTPAIFYGYSSIRKLAGYLLETYGDTLAQFYGASMAEKQPTQADQEHRPLISEDAMPRTARDKSMTTIPQPVAVIGISGRFPGADCVGDFWQRVKRGESAITEVPATRWAGQEEIVTAFGVAGAGGSRRGGFLTDIDRFDALFFEISPQEAKGMDPRQRQFMQEAWRALEDAGYMGARIRGSRCGVFVGVEEGEYG
ncbi:MAG: SDR family NAD(P)-dependent oxidoreductase, partial [Enterobacter roggenkampii]